MSRKGDRLELGKLTLKKLACYEPGCLRDHEITGTLVAYLTWEQDYSELSPVFIGPGMDAISLVSLDESISVETIRILARAACPLLTLFPIFVYFVTGASYE